MGKDAALEAMALEMPKAVAIDLMGIPCIYFDVDPDSTPHGYDMTLMRPGELAPFSGGRLSRGAGVLVIGPEVHERLRLMIRDRIRAAESARAAGPS